MLAPIMVTIVIIGQGTRGEHIHVDRATVRPMNWDPAARILLCTEARIGWDFKVGHRLKIRELGA